MRVIGDMKWVNRMPPLVSLLVYLSVAQVALVGVIALIAVVSVSKDASTKTKNQAALSSR